IFEGADLISLRAGKSSSSPAFPAPPALPAMTIGAVMLASPFFVSRAAAQYLAAPVWLGFIFLLDPVNKRLGGESLTDDTQRTVLFLLGGLLGGLLGEFGNYWAGAKGHYPVPIMAYFKLFEMPLPGYLGFPPFALECFTMFVFVRLMFRRLAG